RRLVADRGDLLGLRRVSPRGPVRLAAGARPALAGRGAGPGARARCRPGAASRVPGDVAPHRRERRGLRRDRVRGPGGAPRAPRGPRSRASPPPAGGVPRERRFPGAGRRRRPHRGPPARAPGRRRHGAGRGAALRPSPPPLAPMILGARAATVRYPWMGLPALDGVDLAIGEGELVAVVGPNGGGKTTLARAILGLAPLQRGAVTLAGRPLSRWRPAELAQLAALVPQREESAFSWRVEEMVSFGRHARLGPLAALSREDRLAVDRALERCDVSALRARRVETLSGGEWQRVRIARALAQEPRLLILDEPTASLDVGHEMELFELVARLVREGLAGLVITHHL